MVAGHVRAASAADLVVVVVFLAATLGVGSLIVHELTAIRSTPAPARPGSSTPAVLPANTVDLPATVKVLPLPDGQELRVGDPAEKVARLLARATEVGMPLVERGRIGDRVSRRYEFGPVSFIVVMEAFERNGVMRVAAIQVR